MSHKMGKSRPTGESLNNKFLLSRSLVVRVHIGEIKYDKSFIDLLHLFSFYFIFFCSIHVVAAIGNFSNLSTIILHIRRERKSVVWAWSGVLPHSRFFGMACLAV